MKNAIIVKGNETTIIDGVFKMIGILHHHVDGLMVSNTSDIDKLRELKEETTVFVDNFELMSDRMQERIVVICDVMNLHLVGFYNDFSLVSSIVKENSVNLLERDGTLLKWVK